MWVSPMYPDSNGAPVSPLGLLGAHPGQGALQLPAHPPHTHTHTLSPAQQRAVGTRRAMFVPLYQEPSCVGVLSHTVPVALIQREERRPEIWGPDTLSTSICVSQRLSGYFQKDFQVLDKLASLHANPPSIHHGICQ